MVLDGLTLRRQEAIRRSREVMAAGRVKVQEAFRRADYATAAELARKVTKDGPPTMFDWLWLGHSCQLSGDWAGAAEAYRQVVASIDADLESGLKGSEAPAGEGAPVGRSGTSRGGRPNRAGRPRRPCAAQ